jgi:class 3 adenylate cyclase
MSSNTMLYGAEPDRILATVLFTDIVASTKQAAEMGDRKWGELLQQHHVLVRRSWRGSVAGRRTRRGIVS